MSRPWDDPTWTGDDGADEADETDGATTNAVELPTASASEPLADADGRRAVKLLQGYLWHPIELEIDFGDYLPRAIDPDIHVLWDPMPRAPFTFFDDGTLSSTQRVYQFTVMAVVEAEEEEEGLEGVVPWLAEVLQAKLETTPEGVGWQVMEDMRGVG